MAPGLARSGGGALGPVGERRVECSPTARLNGLQDHFDDLYKMLTLVYRVVFAHIGYEGRFSTRSDVGWPTATFKGKELLAAMKLV